MGELYDCLRLRGGDPRAEKQELYEEEGRNKMAGISQYGLHDLRFQRYRFHRQVCLEHFASLPNNLGSLLHSLKAPGKRHETAQLFHNHHKKFKLHRAGSLGSHFGKAT